MLWKITNSEGWVNTYIYSIYLFFFTASDQTRIRMEDDSSFKDAFREDHLIGLLRNEVAAGLRCRTIKRSGPISLILPGEGCSLGLATTGSTVYGYGQGKLPMGDLDAVLGRRWDIHLGSEGCRYVTSLTLKLSAEWMLHFTAAYALCRNPLDTQYRTTLAQDINTSCLADDPDEPSEMPTSDLPDF